VAFHSVVKIFNFLLSEIENLTAVTSFRDLKLNLYAPDCLHPLDRRIEKVKQAWTDPEGSRRLRHPELLYNQRMKVARSSALRTGRLYHRNLLC